MMKGKKETCSRWYFREWHCLIFLLKKVKIFIRIQLNYIEIQLTDVTKKMEKSGLIALENEGFRSQMVFLFRVNFVRNSSFILSINLHYLIYIPPSMHSTSVPVCMMDPLRKNQNNSCTGEWCNFFTTKIMYELLFWKISFHKIIF